MEPLGVDEAVSELKRRLEDEKLNTEQKINQINERLNDALNVAARQIGGAVLSQLKSRLFDSGVLSLCVQLLDPKRIKSNWNAAATLAHLLSSCCVGADTLDQSKAFHRLFLPSVMNALLSLAARLVKQTESGPLFRKLLDSVSWLLRAHTHLTAQVLSSLAYEQIQMCEDSSVSLLCLQMWTVTVSSGRDFASGLADDSITLLLNDAVSQLALSSEAAVGRACVRLILLLATQLGSRLHRLLLTFRGLDSLLNKDWRGRGIDQEVDQLIKIVQSSESTEDTERVRAACVIQAAWRSYQTRRRVKNLTRTISKIQRRYRARQQQQQKQQEVQLWEEELRYQVSLRRQQARRKFHLKQRQLLQLLPPEQVSWYLWECERRAALLIQAHYRGFKQRQVYNRTREGLKHRQTEHRAAITIQTQVRRFLERRRASKVPPSSLWIGQKGLTDSRRAELKKQVEDYIASHPSPRVSIEECGRLHEEVQMLLLSEMQRGGERRRQEQRIQALLAHTHTTLLLLREAPPLSSVTQSEAESFLSPSGPIAARARDSHNALLQADRAPWWRTLGNAVTGVSLEEDEEELRGGLFVLGAR